MTVLALPETTQNHHLKAKTYLVCRLVEFDLKKKENSTH